MGYRHGLEWNTYTTAILIRRDNNLTMDIPVKGGRYVDLCDA